VTRQWQLPGALQSQGSAGGRPGEGGEVSPDTRIGGGRGMGELGLRPL